MVGCYLNLKMYFLGTPCKIMISSNSDPAKTNITCYSDVIKHLKLIHSINLLRVVCDMLNWTDETAVNI